jgi:hypothetical protein
MTGDQLDIFAAAEARKQQGMAVADASQPGAWKANVDFVIGRLALTGRPFTSDDVSAITGDSPTGSRGAMGARFNYAARRGVIRRIGYVPSRRVTVHAHPVAQWVGAEEAAA